MILSGAGLRTLIVNEPAIAALIGARCYRNRLQQGSTLPALVFWGVGESSEPTFDTSGVLSQRVQIDVYSDDPDVADTLKRLLFTLFDGYEGTLGDGTRIIDAEHVGGSDESADKPTGYWTFIEFRFQFTLADGDSEVPTQTVTNTVTLTTSAAVSAYLAVASLGGLAVAASSADLSKPAIGIAPNSAVQGAGLQVQYGGTLQNSSWNWNAGQPVFVGVNGVLTQTMPTSGYIQAVGMPISPTTLLIELEEAVPIT